MPLKIAYLVNQYPKVSHSFIRREILALEASGVAISRYSIRSCAAELVDEADQQELAKTRFILGNGALPLLWGLIWALLTRPVQFFRALRLAWKISQPSEQGVLYHLAYLAEACILLRWLFQAKVDHLHAHFGTNSTTVAMLCQALGGPPYSFTVHGPEEFDRVNALALPEKIRRSAFVVAISSFGKSQLYRWCSAREWSKVHVVRCGVDQTFLAHPFTPIPQEPCLVCVGRLCEDKGQLLLVEAAKQLMQQGKKFKLILVGDGELRPQLETVIAEANLQDQITITGWASAAEVRHSLLCSRAMVLPSFAEGLPVVIMEALALGRPVISTTIAGIPELVKTGETGWLIPPASLEDLMEAMQQALDSPIADLERLGKAGADRVARQHDVMTEASKLEKIFRESVGFQEESAAIMPNTAFHDRPAPKNS